MGWYDAFKSASSVGAVLQNTTSNSGSAAKNFGDAFVEFGKSMREVESERKQESVADAKIASSKASVKSLEANSALATTRNTQAAIDNSEKNRVTDVKKFDDAFKKDFLATSDVNYQKSLLEFEAPDGDFDSNVSSDAFDFARKKITNDEMLAQKSFNDEAVKVSINGNYKDYKAFSSDDTNQELIKNIDGTTLKSIENHFIQKDKTSSILKAQRVALANEMKLLKKDKQIISLVKSKENKGFKYSENTGVKIKNLIKTSMGFDNELKMMDSKEQKHYENTVFAVSNISKSLNLEPNLAYQFYVKKSTPVKKESDPLGIR